MNKKQKRNLTIAGIITALIFLPNLLFGESMTSIAQLSYLGLPGYKSGMARNNPGNIIKGAGYKGEIQDDSSRFAKFKFWVYGIRAMIILIRKLITTGSSYPNACVTTPQNTVRLIVMQYAPAASCGGDNDDNTVQTYIQYVANRVGVDPDEILTPNKDTLRRIVQAMAYFEQGRECITTAQFNYAYSLV